MKCAIKGYEGKYETTDTGNVYSLPHYEERLFFGFTKCWLGNYIRKNGNPCSYKDHLITVGERGVLM
jgi:hypothetical protein